MNSLSILSDSELVELASRGQLEAEECLAERYIPLVKKCSRSYFLLGGDYEDLIQEGTFGLISAIRKFDPSVGVSFASFSERCIKNRIISAIRAASSSKHIPLNDGISLDCLSGESFTDAVQCSAEDSVIAAESHSELRSVILNSLTKYEVNVLKLFLEGMSYKEMSERLCKNTKSIDNAVQRIRRKLEEITP